MAVDHLRSISPDSGVETVSRKEFLADYWDYKPGEHVTLLGPTQSGKTTLGYQLMNEVTSKQLPGVILIMKPRDPVVELWRKRLKYRKIRTWPPSVIRNARGWVVWPKHQFQPKQDDETLRTEFRKAILHCYKKGNRVLFVDEVVGFVRELKLETELNAVWMRGAAMGCGLWAASQRPFHVPQNAYEQAEHLCLFRAPDKRSRDRFKEIGGIDNDLVDESVIRLRQYQFLYIRRNPPGMAIVKAK